jgi:hypothetical protein
MSMLRRLISVVAVFSLFVICAKSSVAQAGGYENAPFTTVGVGVKASLLGAGVEAATPLLPRFNLRGGVNLFNYDRTFNKDGVTYPGQLQFRSAEAHIDWFPFGGSLHLSPGLLIYNGNQVTANPSVPGGQLFTLNGTQYMSDPNDPIGGKGKIAFHKAGPMLTAGFGSLVPRYHRFSIPFEIGAIYTGAPTLTLNLTGSACDSTTGLICANIATTPAIQSNVQAETEKINKDMSFFKFYPVISIGFGLKL